MLVLAHTRRGIQNTESDKRGHRPVFRALSSAESRESSQMSSERVLCRVAHTSMEGPFVVTENKEEVDLGTQQVLDLFGK